MVEFALTFTVSLALVLLTIKAAHRYNIFIDCHHSDKPQRFHEKPTPRAGGIAIFLAILPFLFQTFEPLLVIACALAFFSGIIEDYSGKITQKQRLLLQSAAALVAIFGANTYIKTLGLGIEFPYALSILLTVIAIVGVTNSINIIDGLNGLAGGVSLSAFTMFAILSYQLGDMQMLSASLVFMGAITGFLLLNFPNAKIFLGDGGAYLIGFALAVFSIILVQKHPGVSAWFCASLLSYPIWEVLYSIARRKLAKGTKAMGADKMHLHQVVMRRMRLSNPKTSLLIVACFLPFQLASLCFYDMGYVLFGVIIMFVSAYGIAYKYLTRR